MTILLALAIILCPEVCTILTARKAESVCSLMKIFSFNAHLDTMIQMVILVVSLAQKALFVLLCNINTSLTVLYQEGFKTATSLLTGHTSNSEFLLVGTLTVQIVTSLDPVQLATTLQMAILEAVLSVRLVIIVLLVLMSLSDAMKDQLHRQQACMNVLHAVTLSGTIRHQHFVKLNQQITSQSIPFLQFKHALIT